MNPQNFLMLFCFLLNVTKTMYALDPGEIKGELKKQEKFCLEEGKITNIIEFKCYEANTQGPCMPNLTFVQVNGSTGVGHCIEQCIENGERCGTKTCKDLNRVPLLNHQGGVDCACPVSQVQDENGQCQVEFTEGTTCAPGQIILPKALAARYTDVMCDADYSCEDKCNEGDNMFNNILETKFIQFNHKCSDKGKIKNCCLKSSKNAVEHFLNRLSKVYIQLGVCVNNPCTAGTSLFVNNDGKLQCFQLKSPDVIKCKDFLSIEDEQLTCEKISGNLTPLSFIDRQTKKCARGRVWNNHRMECVLSIVSNN